MSTALRGLAICAIALVAMGALLGGCVSVPENPTVEITSPRNGSTIRTSDITVRVNVNHFRTVDKQGEANAGGEGHLHFYMDVDPVPGAAGQPAVPTDANATWAHVSVTSHTFPRVPPGTHTFAVQLVNNDHTPLIPIVSDSVTIIVTP